MNYRTNILKRFLVFAVYFSAICSFGREYASAGKTDMHYVSKRQKKKMFKSVGCDYLNKMEITYPDFDHIKPKQTSYYKVNQALIDSLSKKYHNQVIAHKLAPMYLQWVSPVVGYGVFALQDIAEDDFVGVYAGELRQVREPGDKNPEDVDYAWYYIIDAPSQDELHGKKLIIDGKYRGNELRFINHASDPNTHRIDVLVNGIFYVCYVASKPILKGTQLTVNYGDGYWTSRKVDPEIFR